MRVCNIPYTLFGWQYCTQLEPLSFHVMSLIWQLYNLLQSCCNPIRYYFVGYPKFGKFTLLPNLFHWNGKHNRLLSEKFVLVCWVALLKVLSTPCVISCQYPRGSSYKLTLLPNWFNYRISCLFLRLYQCVNFIR